MSAGGQMRDQIVPDVQVVGEAVHEHEGRPGARIISSVEASSRPGDTVLGELTGIRSHASSYLPHGRGGCLIGSQCRKKMRLYRNLVRPALDEHRAVGRSTNWPVPVISL